MKPHCHACSLGRIIRGMSDNVRSGHRGSVQKPSTGHLDRGATGIVGVFPQLTAVLLTGWAISKGGKRTFPNPRSSLKDLLCPNEPMGSLFLPKMEYQKPSHRESRDQYADKPFVFSEEREMILESEEQIPSSVISTD